MIMSAKLCGHKVLVEFTVNCFNFTDLYCLEFGILSHISILICAQSGLFLRDGWCCFFLVGDKFINLILYQI